MPISDHNAWFGHVTFQLLPLLLALRDYRVGASDGLSEDLPGQAAGSVARARAWVVIGRNRYRVHEAPAISLRIQEP